MSTPALAPVFAVAAIAIAVLLPGCSKSSNPASPSTNPSTPVPSGNAACTAIGGTAASGLAILNGAACTTQSTQVVRVVMRDSHTITTGTCSGTVIASRAVLTAAHCLAGAASVAINPGNGELVVASSFQIPPAYRDASSLDVGVVLLPQDLPATPVPLLLSRDARVGEQAVIAGWGQNDASMSGVLRAGTTTVASVSSAHVEAATYTVGGANSAVCFGDSGGPLLVQEGGAWVVAGVTSAFSGNSCATGRSSFTSIRNSEVSSFVLNFVPSALRR